MLQRLSALSPTALAVGAACLTWAITALGALTVYLLPGRAAGGMGPLMAAAAGVMLAAAHWSLLAPAIRQAQLLKGAPGWLVAAGGLLAGGAFLWAGDAAAGVLSAARAAGPHSEARRRCLLLVAAITLHNIPEGLAIGVAFGGLGPSPHPTALAGAASVALGIGLQNFPEGAAVALPLLQEGMSRRRAFGAGQLSGAVEPVAALAGAVLVRAVRSLLPWALAGAAGAMIYVAAGELLPAARAADKGAAAPFACLAGFALMMVLDVALG